MSNGSRAFRHTGRRRGLSHFVPPRPDEELFVVTNMGAAASEADIEEAKQVTHDGLIRGLGPRRRSGVSWQVLPAAESSSFIEEFGHKNAVRVDYGHANVTRAEADAGLLQFLTDNPDGYLIVAMCEAIA